MSTTPLNTPITTRRIFAITGATGAAALLAACGPHVRPGVAGSSGSSGSGSIPLTTDARPNHPFSASIQAPQAIHTAVPTPPPVTIRPPDPAAGGRLWFDPTPGPPPQDGTTYQMGFWRRSSGRGYWHFVPVSPAHLRLEVIGPADLPSQPAPPADASALAVTRVQRVIGDVIGHWVWNAGRFSASTWAPRWEWVDDRRPHLLVA